MLKLNLNILLFLFGLSHYTFTSAQDLLIPYRKGDLWGYADTNGKIVITPQYKEAGNFFDSPFAIIKENSTYGIIYRTGKILIEPKYDYLEYIGEGIFFCRDHAYNGFLVDSIGKQMNPDTITFAWPFRKGLCIMGKRNGRNGIIDKNGNYLIKPIFQEIEICENGFIKATTVGSRKHKRFLPGYIQYYKPDGSLLTTDKFTDSDCFKKGFAFVRYKGNRVVKTYEFIRGNHEEKLEFKSNSWNIIAWNLINEKGEKMVKGNVVWESQYLNYSGRIIQKGKKFGIMDSTGKMVVDFKYDDISVNYDDVSFKLLIGNEDYDVNDPKGKIPKYGLYISTTQTIIEPQFDEVEKFSGGWAVVSLNGKFNYLGLDGKFLFDEYQEGLTGFYGESAILTRNGKEYWINKKGKIILEKTAELYTDIGRFGEDGFAWVEQNDKKGYIDTTGKEIIECQTGKIISYDNHMQSFIVKDTSWNNYGIYDRAGKNIIPENYEYLTEIYGSNWRKNINLYCHLMHFKKDGKSGVCDFNGNVKFYLTFQEIRYLGGHVFTYRLLEDFQHPSVWGIVDINGNVLLEPQQQGYPNQVGDYLYFYNIGYMSLSGKKFWE